MDKKQLVTIWLVVILIAGGQCPIFAEVNIPVLVKKVQPSTVIVLCYDEKGDVIGQATGFFLNNNGEIITNRHVVKGSNYTKVKTMDGGIYPVKHILAIDRTGDLVRLSLDEMPKKIVPLQLNFSIPEVGEKVIVIGNPMGLEYTVSEGIVSAVRDVETFGKIIQISASISPGSSGSPVLNMKGEVIGIATFGMVEGQNLNFAIPSERIKKLADIEKHLSFNKLAKRIREKVFEKNDDYGKGFELAVSGDFEEALYYFQEALKKNPDQWTYSYIGFCNHQLGRFDEAVKAYKQAIKLDPKDAMSFSEIGTLYFEMGNEKEAIIYLKKAIELDPTGEYIGWYAYANLGTAYFRSKQYHEAIEVLKRAIQIDPKAEGVHYALGLCYYSIRYYNDAIEAYKWAITTDQDNIDIHYNLALAYLMINDKESVLTEYRIIKNLDETVANELYRKIHQ